MAPRSVLHGCDTSVNSKTDKDAFGTYMTRSIDVYKTRTDRKVSSLTSWTNSIVNNLPQYSGVAPTGGSRLAINIPPFPTLDPIPVGHNQWEFGDLHVFGNPGDSRYNALRDAHYTLADELIAAGCADAYICLGHEFNGNGYPWTMYYAADGVTNTPAAYITMWTTVRGWWMSRTNAAFKWVWNPGKLLGAASNNPELCWPGDAYVDVIGYNCYDRDSTYKPSQGGTWYVSRWNKFLETGAGGGYGLNWLNTFATAHGKPMAFPEWGLTTAASKPGGGDDNVYYIEQMHAWMHTKNVEFSCYFNLDGDGDQKLVNVPDATADPTHPLGRERYKALWNQVTWDYGSPSGGGTDPANDVPIVLAQSANTTDQINYTVTTSRSVTANKKILVCVCGILNSGDQGGVDPTLGTGANGLGVSSWTKVTFGGVDAYANWIPSLRRMFVYQGMTASPSGTSLTVNFGAVTLHALEAIILELPTADTTTTIMGVGKADPNIATITEFSGSQAYSANGAGEFQVVFLSVRNAQAFTAKSGWTELANCTQATPSNRTAAFYKPGTGTDGNAASWAAVDKAGGIVITYKKQTVGTTEPPAPAKLTPPLTGLTYANTGALADIKCKQLQAWLAANLPDIPAKGMEIEPLFWQSHGYETPPQGTDWDEGTLTLRHGTPLTKPSRWERELEFWGN